MLLELPLVGRLQARIHGRETADPEGFGKFTDSGQCYRGSGWFETVGTMGETSGRCWFDAPRSYHPSSWFGWPHQESPGGAVTRLSV